VPTRIASSRPVGVPVRTLAALVAAGAGLVVAFVMAPPRLAGGDLADPDHLGAAFRTSLVEYWRSGDRTSPPALQHVVDYWFRFHLFKGGIAALLLVVFVALAIVLWRARLRNEGLGTGTRAALLSAGTAVPLLALFALAVVMANIQGAMAPFGSLFPLLMDGSPDDGVASTLAQARHQLAGSHRTSGYTPPALDAMVSEFAWYHVAIAIVAVVVLVALLSLTVVFWRGFAKTRSAARRPLAWFGACSALLSLIVLGLIVINVSTAMDPAPALLGLFNGEF
jgi:heme/copper-type cytochrome/quinol oxidase subunit 2